MTKVYVLKEFPILKGHVLGESQIIGVISKQSVAEKWSNSDNKDVARTRVAFELDDIQLLERIARGEKVS